MKRVYVASPFKGATVEETRQNIVYADLCMLDSLERGEAPFLSHLLYTRVWAETPELRERGLLAGDAWRDGSELVAFYLDLGWTPGIERASSWALARGRLVEHRYLGGGSLPTTPDGWRAHLATLPLTGFPALEAT